MGKKMKEYIAKSGETFEVNISDEACARFPDRNGKTVKHSDKIKVECYKQGIVVGVAPSFCSCSECSGEKGEDTLWYILDRDNGRASFGGTLEKID